MSVKNEEKYMGDFLMDAGVSQSYTSETVVQADGQTLKTGDLFYLSTGEAVLLASGQESNVAGVILNEGATPGTFSAVVRGPAILLEDALNYGTANAGSTNTALKALGFVIKSSVTAD